MAKRTKPRVTLSEEAARLLSQIPQVGDMPVLPNEQIDEVAEQVRKRLRQRVGLAKAEEWRREFEQVQKTGRVTIGPGVEGVLTEATKETRVSFFEILVDGKPFFGAEAFKPLLEDYLVSIPGDTVDVTFLHSARVKLGEPAKKGRSRAKPTEQTLAAKPDDMVNINCTVRVPKALALAALEDKIMRMKELARIAADIEERQEHASAPAASPESSPVQSQTGGQQ